MNAKLHDVNTTPEHPSGTSTEPAEKPAVNDRKDVPPVVHSESGRALRNWLIAANIVAWLAIVFGIKLIFF